MDMTKFVELSLGSWRSQRSAHHLAFRHFEEVTSSIDIIALKESDSEVISLCQSYKIDPTLAAHPFRMSWQGETDWDDLESTFEGTTILVPIPDLDNPKAGRLLRDQGYAETIPSVGQYQITEDGTFVLKTAYDRAMAEEKIWFVNPNFRLRISLIKTSQGSGVVTASFSSETRILESKS
ncbi:putative phycoerythrin-associated linker protein, CpeS (plasmid) [Rippkaea orientalis PCC 8801]|uniref:Chromophore lyase CpcS/CpeS n=1 Tax=Rippkaea orientalis (strain PCC 8801 / RF-1) TaxID=41431 RepID=B7K6L5_RIPO1|nr:phycobiliprotein lyase [Rippkaea orientalis]ACK68437.1 putative phycoerythrin-associated linker protein, CpeS [Rippkaea orientalis PCC 8801]